MILNVALPKGRLGEKVYEMFEKPLVKDGWDVIVFVPSEEEDSDRITCGNSLIATEKDLKSSIKESL